MRLSIILRIAPTLSILALACSGAQQVEQTTRPVTVAQAVAELRTKWLDSAARDWVLRNPKEAVVTTLYRPFGMTVRNAWGLWGDNAALRESCGNPDPELCSSLIFGALWDALRADADPGLVHALDCQFAFRALAMIRYRGFGAMRMGDVLKSLAAQVDSQARVIAPRLPAGCHAHLRLRITGSPNLKCRVRAEFSEDGHDPVSLGAFLGWFTWRNGIAVRHAPPLLELGFRDPCTWPERQTE